MIEAECTRPPFEPMPRRSQAWQSSSYSRLSKSCGGGGYIVVGSGRTLKPHTTPSIDDTDFSRPHNGPTTLMTPDREREREEQPKCDGKRCESTTLHVDCTGRDGGCGKECPKCDACCLTHESPVSCFVGTACIPQHNFKETSVKATAASSSSRCGRTTPRCC